MRALILVAAASLAISACGTKQGSDNAVATSDNLAAEAIIANDTTAIDAATGDAANMAADVDYTISPANSGSGDVAASGHSATRRRPAESADANSSGDNSAETAVDSNGV
jgi:hypothetical protein